MARQTITNCGTTNLTMFPGLGGKHIIFVRDAGKTVGQGGPTGAKGHLLPKANKSIPEMEGIRGTFWGISWAMHFTVI